MTKKEKWIVDKDDGLRLFYGDENFNGSAYPCNDIVFMKMIADKLNKLEKENEHLKKALLFYIDVALCGTSSNFNKDFDNLCNNLFGCSYNEIKHLYSDINDEDDVFALFQGGDEE